MLVAATKDQAAKSGEAPHSIKHQARIEQTALDEDLAAIKQAEQQHTNSRGAVKCANIRHIWQLESADMKCSEKAKSMVQQIQTFIKEQISCCS